VNGIHKPEPSADKTAGHDKAQETGGKSDNDLQHIEFRV
jgi:hypothetical protein